MDWLSIWLFCIAEQFRVLLAGACNLRWVQRDIEKPCTEMWINDQIYSLGEAQGRRSSAQGGRWMEGSKPLVLIPFFSLKCPSCILGLFLQNPAISITENVLHFKGQYPGKCSQSSTQLKRHSDGCFLFLSVYFIHFLLMLTTLILVG